MAANTDCAAYLGLACILATILAYGDTQCVVNESVHSVNPNCVKVVNRLRAAVFEDPGNKYILPEIFYPESRIQPHLLQVQYQLNYSLNCSQTTNDSFTFGWSKTPIYSYFHAAVLNQLRYQLPFWVMNFARQNLSSEPDTDALMWIGSPWSLSVLHLNLTLNDTCYDDDQLMKNALYSLTKYVSHKSLSTVNVYCTYQWPTTPTCEVPVKRGTR